MKQINVHRFTNTRTSKHLENISNENKTIKASTMRLNSTGIMRQITKLTGTRHTINKREESKKSPTCIERKANEMSVYFFFLFIFVDVILMREKDAYDKYVLAKQNACSVHSVDCSKAMLNVKKKHKFILTKCDDQTTSAQ